MNILNFTRILMVGQQIDIHFHLLGHKIKKAELMITNIKVLSYNHFLVIQLFFFNRKLNY